MGRAPCCDKANVKRGPWSPEEDAKLKAYIQQHGTGGNWISLPQKIGLKRCGKSCRLRWLNYLRPNIKHGGFSAEEDEIICSLYVSIGSRWSVIAAQLPGRTDNDIKNYWNTRLKKKLLGNKLQSPTVNNFFNQNPYSPEIPMDALNSHCSNLDGANMQHILEGQSSFSLQNQEIGYGNPKRLDGMEFLHGDDIVNGTSSDLVCPPFASEYGGILQHYAPDQDHISML
ncbi:hypothetical protein HRI_005194200 [Hibiscus trionum]|uniref:Uncharacterized protein n=1 Tax=Hibiscus trionum TaxID=183268 RepID=A0A9W7MWQ4_HIBTR|nr:hypothetical protein HRI_005194200 [Hibiscus trionum]